MDQGDERIPDVQYYGYIVSICEIIGRSGFTNDTVARRVLQNSLNKPTKSIKI